MIRLLVIGASFTFFGGCAASLVRTDNFDACESLSDCEVRGVASAKAGEHGRVVEVRTASGKCINLSVPDESWNRLKEIQNRLVQAKGRVISIPTNEFGEDIILEIDGRRIGYGKCGNFIIYVSNDRDFKLI